MDNQSIYRDPPVLVRARFEASRHQNLNEWRLSRDLEEFEEAWEATRRKQMLAGMQPQHHWLAWAIAVGAVLAGLGIVFLLESFGVV